MASEWCDSAYGRFPADFRQDNLRSLCDSAEGIQTGPFGSQLHQSDYVHVGTPIITVEHLGENRIIHEGVPRVSDVDRERLARYTLRQGDIVFSRVGSVDRRSLVREDEDGWMFSGRCLRVRPNLAKIDAAYLSYFFGLPAFKEYIRAIAVGATMPSLNTQILSDVPVVYPPSLPEQRAIAHILGTLDDKIELNRRMAHTLEEMARALFKAWFVDFEPVRAKMEGRWRRGESLPGLPAHLYDLFPDRLVDSELGPIPEGWRRDSVYEVSYVVYGAPFKSDLFNDAGDGTPLLRIRDLATHCPGVFTTEVHTRGYLVAPGDLVVGMDGEFRAHLWHGPRAWLNQRMCCFKPKAGVPRAFLHYSIEGLLDFFERSKTGTTVIHLGKGDIDTFQLLLPTEHVFEAFGSVVESLDLRIVIAAQEARTLAELRDALLPRLISGDLLVTDSDRILAGAG